MHLLITIHQLPADYRLPTTDYRLPPRLVTRPARPAAAVLLQVQARPVHIIRVQVVRTSGSRYSGALPFVRGGGFAPQRRESARVGTPLPSEPQDPRRKNGPQAPPIPRITRCSPGSLRPRGRTSRASGPESAPTLSPVGDSADRNPRVQLPWEGFPEREFRVDHATAISRRGVYGVCVCYLSVAA